MTSPIRLNIQVEDKTRTQELLRRGEVVGAISIQPEPLPGCLVDKLGALDYLFVSSPIFAERYFPTGVTKASLLRAPAVAFDHLDDIAKRLNFDDIIYMSYSIDFRSKVIFTIEEGLSIRETAKQFRIGSASVSR
ncbi:HTH-type transcriptional regulator ArgP [Arsenophonus endosymbiont of Bemisia tabaci Q2]|nr:HTH-type transcriptional regulator ArgP [Arsenophonus endosymbiont of Bemisia tabaci Q2]